MLVDTKNFYSPSLLHAQATLNPQNRNDEEYLHDLVVKAGHRLPKAHPSKKDAMFYLSYRPTHRIHLSQNRGPGK